jgi:hypothetical protein
MARETYVIRDGQLVPKRLAAPRNAPHGAGPFIISDTIDLVNPLDGRRYDSRQAYDRVARARGLVEVGSEDLSKHIGRRPEPAQREIVEAIRHAMHAHGVRQ